MTDPSANIAFWSKVAIAGPNECWEWGGSRSAAGYGSFSYGGKRWVASRYSLALSLGRDIRAGYCACHSCDNPPCVNPKHLWEGTTRDNAKDAASKGRLPLQKRSHCKHGHPFDKENTRYNSRGQRQCRACQRRMRHRARTARRAAARASLSHGEGRK